MKAERGFPFTGVLIGMFAVAAVAAIGLFFHAQSLTRAAREAWQEVLEQRKAAGEPTSFDELFDSLPAITPAENGFRVIDAMSASLEAVKEEAPQRVLFFDSSLRNAVRNSIIPRFAVEPSRRFLSRHTKLIADLGALKRYHTGRSLSREDFQNDDPLPVLLPWLAPVRTAARLLNLSAALAAVDADMNEAANSIALSLRVASTLDGDATIISRVYKIAVERQAVETLGLALHCGSFSASERDHVRSLLEDRLANATLKTSMQAEFLCMIQLCESILNYRITLGDVDAGGLKGRVTEKLIRENQIEFGRCYFPLIDASDNPLAFLRATAQLDRRAKNQGTAPYLGPQTLAGMFVPSLSRIGGLHATRVAQLRVALCVLAADAYEESNGHLPTSLEALMPDFLDAVPLDPFDEQPLRMVTRDGHVVIYSIGVNQVDDGGELAVHDKHRNSLDVGIRLVDRNRRPACIDETATPSTAAEEP